MRYRGVDYVVDWRVVQSGLGRGIRLWLQESIYNERFRHSVLGGNSPLAVERQVALRELQ